MASYLNTRLRWMMVFLFAGWVLLACQGTGLFRPTPVPSPTETAVPTPTMTPAPTSTPFAPPGYRAETSPEQGLLFAYPETWVVEKAPHFVRILSSHDDLFRQQGAIVQIQAKEAQDFDAPSDPYTDSTLDLLRAEVNRWVFYVPPSKFQMMERPAVIDIGGQEAAQATFHFKTDQFPPRPAEEVPGGPTETGWHLENQEIWVNVTITFIRFERWAALVFTITPVESEEQFAAEFDTILDTVRVGEPSAAGVDA